MMSITAAPPGRGIGEKRKLLAPPLEIQPGLVLTQSTAHRGMPF